MTTSGIVTLLTDFGLADPFVGQMHGVILSRFRDARIVDLAHGVAAQDIGEASFWLSRSAPWFPPGTVHVAVVDPGVGTDRAALVLDSGGQLVVAPDNGLVTPLLGAGARAFRVDPARFALGDLSRTFHGRDLFAPVAAELAAGRVQAKDVGPALDPVRLSRATPRRSTNQVHARIVSVDRFGNLISDADAALVADLPSPTVECGGVTLALSGTYADVAEGALCAVISSFDTVEIAVRGGNARARLGVDRGAPVVIRGR